MGFTVKGFLAGHLVRFLLPHNFIPFSGFECGGEHYQRQPLTSQRPHFGIKLAFNSAGGLTINQYRLSHNGHRGSIHAIRQYLGHRSIATTQIYIDDAGDERVMSEIAAVTPSRSEALRAALRRLHLNDEQGAGQPHEPDRDPPSQ